jgi:toxin ParE1/3/4
MARLTITESARADLREIRAHIAQDNPAAARRVIERLRVQARNLAATPGMGRSRKDLRANLFSFPVDRHVLFYRPQPGGIVLVRVIHGARDQPSYVGNDRYCQLLTIFAR